MGTLETLADGKISSARGRLAETLRADMAALHRRLVAQRGFGGHLTVESQALCLRRLSEHGQVITENLAWVITEALWISDALVNRLVERAGQHLDPFVATCTELMGIATDLTGDRGRLMPDVEVALNAQRDQVWNEIGIALHAKKAERVRLNVWKAGGALLRALAWLLRMLGFPLR